MTDDECDGTAAADPLMTDDRRYGRVSTVVQVRFAFEPRSNLNLTMFLNIEKCTFYLAVACGGLCPSNTKHRY